MSLQHAPAAYRELGDRLRQMRQKTGMSIRELARRQHWPATMVYRMESGKRDSSTTEVAMFAVRCGVTLKDAEPLLELTRLAGRHQGYWLSDKRLGGSLQSLIFHEAAAESSTSYEPQVIPGLLQTPEYAYARIAAREPDLSPEEVLGAVRTREDRKLVLLRRNPGRFTFYIAEQALRLRVGSTAVMHEQLLHLVLTSGMDHVTARIVPSEAGAQSAFGGPFRCLEYDTNAPVVYLDHVFGGLILEDKDHVENYRDLVARLADVAMDEGESREFAAELADAHDRGSQRDAAHGMAEEQPQRRIGNGLRGGGVAEEQPQRGIGERLRGGGVAEARPIYE